MLLSTWSRACSVALALLLALGLPTGHSMAGGSAPTAAHGWQVIAPQRPFPLFHLATGLTLDRSRNIYVADSVEGRVKKFSPQGRLLASWGSDGPGPTHWYPQGVAVDAAGHVYVLAPDQEPWQQITSSHVVKLTPSGHVIMQWDVGSASAIAVGGGGNVFVFSIGPTGDQSQSRSARVDKYTPQGTLLSTWGSPAINGDAVQANGIAVDPHGNVYVTVGTEDDSPRAGPTITRYVYRFSPSGVPVRIQPKTTVGPVQATDRSGNIYFAPEEYGQQAIVKLSPAGALLARWTAAGRDSFGSYVHLALDSRGKVYVADAHNVNITRGWADSGLIHILSPSGRLLARWGQILPYRYVPLGGSIALGPGGTIYTTAAISYVFLTVSPGSHTFRMVGRTSDKPPVIDSPQAIAVDSRGSVYITDESSGHVDKLSGDGRVLAQWAVVGPNQGPMDGIALDRSGNMYVLALHQIVKLSPAGKVLARYGSFGSGPGQFSAPYSLTVDTSGNIFVADTRNNRIQKISPTGKWLASWGSLPQLEEPVGVAVDGTGNVYAVNPNHGNIIEYSPNGAVLATFGVPGVLPGQFTEPVGITIDARGNLYVLDAENYRVQELVR